MNYTTEPSGRVRVRVARGSLLGAEPTGASSDWTVRMLVCDPLLAAPASEPT